jgi:hypothetical protein
MTVFGAIKMSGEEEFVAYPGIRLNGLRKTKENLIQNNLADVLAGMKTGHHPNKIQNR